MKKLLFKWVTGLTYEDYSRQINNANTYIRQTTSTILTLKDPLNVLIKAHQDEFNKALKTNELIDVLNTQVNSVLYLNGLSKPVKKELNRQLDILQDVIDILRSNSFTKELMSDDLLTLNNDFNGNVSDWIFNFNLEKEKFFDDETQPSLLEEE